jgi:dimethylaniline monooxygenase (N-oxide forming)
MPTFGRPESGRRVAVIGAGAAGLTAAKTLLAGGHDVTVFEKGSRVGGMWVYENDNGASPAYFTLHINTAKKITAFGDFPFAGEVGLFPSHWEMASYLEDYARHFEVTKHIRFNRVVSNVEPVGGVQGEQGWIVTLDDGETQIFDVVVAATGHLSEPSLPAEFAAFGGDVKHSFHYRRPGPYAGQRVCVVGTGNSAMDIASDLCVVADRTVIVARSGVRIAPKIMFGRPLTDLTLPLWKPWIPQWVRDWTMRTITYIIHGDITRFGFKPVEKRVHVTTNPTVIQHIAYGRIAVKQGITRIDGNEITFADGATETFDALVAATGYRVTLPFVSPDIAPITDNETRLYKRMIVPDHTNLFFVGLLNSDTALNQIFELQSQLIAGVLAGSVSLPSPTEMERDIADKSAWVRARYKDSPRHRIEEPQVQYAQQLRALMRGRKAS